MKRITCAVLAMMVCFTLFIGCEEKDPGVGEGERYYTHKEPKPNSRVDQYGYDRIIHETERYGNVYGDIELSEVEDYLGPGQLIEVYRAKTGETYRKYAWLGENGEKLRSLFIDIFSLNTGIRVILCLTWRQRRARSPSL